jgi:hypothetical protein
VSGARVFALAGRILRQPPRPADGRVIVIVPIVVMALIGYLTRRQRAARPPS